MKLYYAAAVLAGADIVAREAGTCRSSCAQGRFDQAHPATASTSPRQPEGRGAGAEARRRRGADRECRHPAISRRPGRRARPGAAGAGMARYRCSNGSNFIAHRAPQGLRAAVESGHGPKPSKQATREALGKKFDYLQEKIGDGALHPRRALLDPRRLRLRGAQLDAHPRRCDIGRWPGLAAYLAARRRSVPPCPDAARRRPHLRRESHDRHPPLRVARPCRPWLAQRAPPFLLRRLSRSGAAWAGARSGCGTTTRSPPAPASRRIPHRDMEIITYVREGAITHQDSMGNQGRTGAGDVQVMSRRHRRPPRRI